MDQARRKELYTEAWNIVNVELPFFYLHEITHTSAAAKTLRATSRARRARSTTRAVACAPPIWRRMAIPSLMGRGRFACQKRGDADVIRFIIYRFFS